MIVGTSNFRESDLFDHKLKRLQLSIMKPRVDNYITQRYNIIELAYAYG
jgi:hypothetical protein